MAAPKSLKSYRDKRDFSRTPEPAEGGAASEGALSFVIQKHHASHLHYDFRLELDGTLKSWAVPKGPCLDATVKRMAVQVEDHPLSYGGFEGTIPRGQYGAGNVIVWDRGDWVPEGGVRGARKALAEGKLKFALHGEKLSGHWTLVRMRGKGETQAPWLLIKERDAATRPLADYDVTDALPDSVLTGQPIVPRERVGARADGTVKPNKAQNNGADGRRPAAARSDWPPEATKAALPKTFAPQLATLASSPPASPEDWLYELKFDGYRLLARIEAGDVRCFTRNGHDWTGRLPELAVALGRLNIDSAWLDGEIVVEDARHAPDFQALQNAFDTEATGKIVYHLFDVPFLGGRDLRQVPLEARRALLAQRLGKRLPARLRFSQSFDAAPEDLLASAAELGFEGIVGKRRDSTYRSQRSPDWIKLKHDQRQEFVIGGFTAPQGARSGFGALLLGVYDSAGDKGKLRYCGNVGTGFDARRLADLTQRLKSLKAARSPFASVPASVKATWVKPDLVAEVSFGQWTHEGRLRHSVFQGLRADKPARQIVREQAVAPADGRDGSAPVSRKKGDSAASKRSAVSKRAPAGLPEGLRVTHADRVIDNASGFTKGDLVGYYARVAALMLPHLRGRPVSLVRAPAGIGGELFFQKHSEAHEINGISLLDAALDPGHAPLLQIDRAEGLLSAAQLNVIELHTWNATSRAIDRPDRITLDLDPGEGVPWQAVQEGALLVRTLLVELGLPAFLKTSGGKGLHVVTPIRRRHGWDTVKAFSQTLVQHLAQTIPERFVARSGPKNRIGKIFVDYLRNGFGATTVAAWSVRARPGLGVSVPVEWDELPDVTSGAHWTVANVASRFEIGNTPWDGIDTARKGIGSAMKKIGFEA